MIILVLPLLAATYVAAEDFSSQYQQQPMRIVPHYVPASAPEIPPIDINDDIYNRDYWHNPRLSYHFQQVRKDQPPHLEDRDESLGKYIGRRSRTTTTTIRPIIPTFAPIEQQSYEVPTSNSYIDHINKWNDNLNQVRPAAPSTTYLPPSPPTGRIHHWQEPIDEQSTPEYPARQPWWNAEMLESVQSTTSSNIPTFAPTYQSPQTPEFNPPHWHEPSSERYAVRARAPPATQAPLIPSYDMRSFMETSTSSSTEPVWAHQETTFRSRQHERPRNTNRGRGSYKFNLDDMSHSTPEQNTPTQRSALNPNKPPPPIPTLTPWYGDNFGK